MGGRGQFRALPKARLGSTLKGLDSRDRLVRLCKGLGYARLAQARLGSTRKGLDNRDSLARPCEGQGYTRLTQDVDVDRRKNLTKTLPKARLGQLYPGGCVASRENLASSLPKDKEGQVLPRKVQVGRRVCVCVCSWHCWWYRGTRCRKWHPPVPRANVFIWHPSTSPFLFTILFHHYLFPWLRISFLTSVYFALIFRFPLLSCFNLSIPIALFFDI